MKIVTWNILDPIWLNMNNYEDLDKKYLNMNRRLSIIHNTLQRVNPDVICFQEVSNYTYNLILNSFHDYYVSPLGYHSKNHWFEDYSFTAPIPFQKNGNCTLILKKHKFLKNIRKKISENGNYCLLSQILIDNKKINIINIHFDSRSKTKRHQQMIGLIEKTKNINDLVVLGDFNSNYDEHFLLFKNNFTRFKNYKATFLDGGILDHIYIKSEKYQISNGFNSFKQYKGNNAIRYTGSDHSYLSINLK